MNYRLSHVTKGIVNLMLSLAVALLGMRFILKLFGANGSNEFVSWIYATSAEVLGPFRGVFPAQDVDGFVVEFSTIFAVMVYLIIGMFALYIIELLTPRKQKKRK